MIKKLLVSSILAAVLASGCNSGSSDTFPPYIPDVNTEGRTDTIASNVLRLAGGADLSKVPHQGAYAVVFNTPKEKIESAYSTVPSYSGTVVSSAANSAAVLAAFGEDTDIPQQYPDDSGLFPPSERMKRLEEATPYYSEIKSAVTPRKAFAVGERWDNVNVINMRTDVYFKVNTECIAVSDHAFFMKEIAAPEIPAELLKSYVENFSKSRSTVHTNFGTESDIDNNGKVIILFFDMQSDSALGYFNPVDKVAATNSNLADIFYVNTSSAVKKEDEQLINFTLAHELQHMVFHDTRKVSNPDYNASTWLDEGLSMLAPYLAGYYNDGQDSHIQKFLSRYSGLSLTNWTSSNYGYSMLFAVYLYDRFGPDVIKKIYGQDVAGWRVVERVTGMDFNTLFGDFAVAIAVSGRGYTDNPIYNFKGIDFKKYSNTANTNLIPDEKAVNAGASYSFNLLPYSMRLREISGVATNVYLSGSADGFLLIR